jgi:hypothetical protein
MLPASLAVVARGCAAALAVAGASAAVGVASAAAPAKDSFVASVTAASGKFAGDHGGITIVLAPGPGGLSRRLTVTLRGGSCGASKHCIAVSGKLTGSLTRGPAAVPDVGSSLRIRASGTIKSVGKVSATGTVHGTGFIARGQETLKLKLTAPGGTITIGADSGLVPGGTSP